MLTKKRPPTIKEVARLAGVNRVTVSVALNGSRASTQVSEATRQRIREAADQLGYCPSAMSQALRRQCTDLIGFYMGYAAMDARDPFTADVLNGLQDGCYQCKKDLLTFGSFERRSEDEIYSALASGKVDGLVTIPTSNNGVLEKVIASHLPVVVLANSLAGAPCVIVDDAEGARLQARHLAGKGHRRILYRQDPRVHTSSVKRLTAFQEEAASLGIQIILTTPANDEQALSDSERNLLHGSRDARPTAAVCWTDGSAYPLIRYCKAHGLSVPGDLAVVGFDGVTLRIDSAYNLTTIRAPWAKAATTAVEILMAVLQGEEVPQETVLPVELMVGETT